MDQRCPPITLENLAKSVKFRLFEKSPFFSGQKDNKIVQAKKHLSQ
jgi:hypothetical protein